MINHHITAQVVSIFLAIIFTAAILDQCAWAYYLTTTWESEDLNEYYAGLMLEQAKSSKVRTFLRENELALPSVTDEELDYIVLLASQLSSFYDSFSPGLILAMIAYESQFEHDAISLEYGARGLMQIIPLYHEDRIMQFVEETESYSRDLFYNPRLNIMTGCDYMNTLLSEANGDLAYALMMYNQGPSSATRDYKYKGYISSYARDIITTADLIDEVINK